MAGYDQDPTPPAEGEPVGPPLVEAAPVPEEEPPRLSGEELHDLTRELQTLVLGGPVRYTRDEVSAAARMTMEEVRRLWRAMGFADVGDYPVFTDADLAALLRVSSMIERELLDFDAIVEVARSLGQTTARLSDWQVDSLGRRLLAEAGEESDRLSAEAIPAARDQLSELLPEFEHLLGYVWRRQVAATLARVFVDFDDATEETGQATVGFTDLVSFTRLSRQLDETALAKLVQTFETAAADVVHAAGGRLVKTLGDEVMFICDTPSVAAEIGLRLHDLSRAGQDIPQMRAGLATGDVLTRMGDVFGTTVNRASRLTASARPGTTLLDAATAEALSAAKDDRFRVRALTPRPIRGLGIVRPYALTHGELRMRDWGGDQAGPVEQPAAGEEQGEDQAAETGSSSDPSSAVDPVVPRNTKVR